MDQSSALGQFTRIEEKVLQEEARAAALGELDQDTLEDRFAALDTESVVENELAALKAKKGLAAPAATETKALGSGDDEDPT